MNFRIDFKGWRFYIALSHSIQVEGVNSKLPDGRHFLMWDFDDVDEYDVKWGLRCVQVEYGLAPIYVVNTGLPKHYHAYCFTSRTFPDTYKILAETEHLDQVFLKIGAIRGYFTLRYSPKKDRDFQPALILPSKRQPDVNPFELSNFVKYWTKRV